VLRKIVHKFDFIYKIRPNNSNAPVRCYSHKRTVQMWVK